MRILFVSSGNRLSGIAPVVLNQGNSIMNAGVSLDYFLIEGKGLLGYLRNITPVRKKINENNYSLIHAHYALSGIVASLATRKPVITSLMGSDLYENIMFRIIARFFSRYRWKRTIVKSEKMFTLLKNPHADVIPNGVDFNRFKPGLKEESIKKLSLNADKKYILFVGDPARKEKNYGLAEASVQCLNDDSVVLLPVYGKDISLMPLYYHVSELLLVTSKWEGSPNAVKEALASNCPVVSVDVGDAMELLKLAPNCEVTKPEARILAAAIQIRLRNSIKTNIRETIEHLDERLIAKKIIRIYKEAIA